MEPQNPNRADRKFSIEGLGLASDLYLAARLIYQTSRQPGFAVENLRQAMFALMRAVVGLDGSRLSNNQEILSAYLASTVRENLPHPIEADLPFLDLLKQRIDQFETPVSSTERLRFESILSRFPVSLRAARKQIGELGKTPREVARQRLLKRLAAVIGIAAVLGVVSPWVWRGGRTIYSKLAYDGVVGTYFADQAMTKFVFERVDPNIDFDWGPGAPAMTLSPDNFGIRWEGRLRIPATGEYWFFLTSDDGSRLFIDGKLVVDNWGDHGMVESQGQVRLNVGDVPVRVDYYNSRGQAGVHLSWSSDTFSKTIVPPSAFFR